MLFIAVTNLMLQSQQRQMCSDRSLYPNFTKYATSLYYSNRNCRYLNKGRSTLLTLALLCQFTAQHVSDVNTSIFRSLRLLGALLCRLYCGKCKLQNIISSLYYKFYSHVFHNTAYTTTHQVVASS